MSVLGIVVDAFIAWGSQHPDTFLLAALIVGGYYELHHGTIHDLSETQEVIGAAIYKLFEREEDLDEVRLRQDLWEDDDQPYPGDYEVSEREVAD